MSFSLQGSVHKVLATLEKQERRYVVTRVMKDETILDIQFHGSKTFILTLTHLHIINEEEEEHKIPLKQPLSDSKYQLFVLYSVGAFAIRLPETNLTTLYLPKRFQSWMDPSIWTTTCWFRPLVFQNVCVTCLMFFNNI
jgi:hypothetical protein